MSVARGSAESEALLSFELIVDYVRVDKDGGHELAVAVRLLDFPTLLIYQPERSGPEVDRPGQVSFNRGKCCLFRMSPDSLNAQLSNAPLHLMLLDVREEVPRLVGTSLISLTEVTDRLRQDLVHQGPSAASAHGRRGLVGVRSLTGDQVGLMSLSYKLSSLGRSLLSRGTDAHAEPYVEVEETPPDTTKEARRTNQEEKTTLPVMEDCQDEDVSVFCPPRLYYYNSAEERRRNEADYKALKLDPDFLTFQDLGGNTEEEEEEGDRHKRRHNSQGSSKSKVLQMSRAAPHVLRDTLRQLPLLNALLVELSQLNVQNPEQRDATPKQEVPQEPRGAVSPELKHVPRPRHCSTPAPGSEGRLKKPAPTHTSRRRRLVIGTTRTFNLRLKRVSPVLARQRECVDLVHNRTTENIDKEQVKPVQKVTKSSPRRPRQSLNLNETGTQTIPANSGPHEPITMKPPDPVTRTDPGPGRRSSDRPPSSERTQAFTSDPNNTPSQQSRSEYDRFRRPSSERSRTQSPESSTSASSRGHGDADANYADDFNSLEPSDAVSSPESWRAKTPGPPLTHPNSDFEVSIKAWNSPQRALRTTQTIRTQNQNQALSLSSEDGDEHSWLSPQTMPSGTRMQSSRDQRSSRPQSVRSRSPRRYLRERSSPGGLVSPESSSSFSTQEAGDEVGPLDFKTGYRHISELPAVKLPGYTM